MNKQTDARRKVDLQLNFDHFVNSQTKFVIEEQIKCVAAALRAEERVKEHLVFTNHRKEMLSFMARSKQFVTGASAI